MFGTIDLSTYVIGAMVVVVLPGPNSMYCLTMSAKHGTRQGYQAVAGIIVGDGILESLTALGAGTLLRLYPTLFVAMKMIGGLYLTYLGVKLLISAYKTYYSYQSDKSYSTHQNYSAYQNYQSRNLTATGETADVDRAKAGIKSDIPSNTEHSDATDKPPEERFFLKALLLSLTNPKAILFLLSFFVQFVDPNYPNPLLSFLLLAIILQGISLCYLSVMVLAGERLATRFRQYPWLAISSMCAIGLLFIGFAVSLWLAQLV